MARVILSSPCVIFSSRFVCLLVCRLVCLCATNLRVDFGTRKDQLDFRGDLDPDPDFFTSFNTGKLGITSLCFPIFNIHCESKNCTLFVSSITLSNVDRF